MGVEKCTRWMCFQSNKKSDGTGTKRSNRTSFSSVIRVSWFYLQEWDVCELDFIPRCLWSFPSSTVVPKLQFSPGPKS